MKKIIVLISALISCIFIYGCSIPAKEKVQSLEDAYFYILNKKEELGINDVKNILKDYKLDIVDNTEVHDVEGEKSYGYRFGDDKTYLNVSFIVSENDETIDFIEYHLDNDRLLLVSAKGDELWKYNITYSQLNKSICEKILKEKNQLGISIQRKENQYSLEGACIYIIDSLANNKDIKIKDVKKLLKDYSFESDLVEDEPEDNLKMYSYAFRNDNMENISVTNTTQNNKEYISDIVYIVGEHPQLSIGYTSGDDTVHVDYYTSDKTTHEKAYDLINKLK